METTTKNIVKSLAYLFQWSGNPATYPCSGVLWWQTKIVTLKEDNDDGLNKIEC